jgi:hypothetical protein
MEAGSTIYSFRWTFRITGFVSRNNVPKAALLLLKITKIWVGEELDSYFNKIPVEQIWKRCWKRCNIQGMGGEEKNMYVSTGNRTLVIQLVDSKFTYWVTAAFARYKPLHIYFSTFYWHIFWLALQPLCARASFQFSDLFTIGRSPWTSDQLFARPLPKHRRAQTQNKHIKWDMNPRPQRPSKRRQFMF